VISQDNNGNFTRAGNRHKTEKPITVLRAAASWIADLEECPKNNSKNRFCYFTNGQKKCVSDLMVAAEEIRNILSCYALPDQ
jgi:hypothetical protein